ncbi:hypothetical protein IKP13_05500 [bacterium]|nr:hypothetical protein [bacterium]
MQKSLLFLIVFFSFLSLSADWGEDLCEDVTCSGHGECHPIIYRNPHVPANAEYGYN